MNFMRRNFGKVTAGAIAGMTVASKAFAVGTADAGVTAAATSIADNALATGQAVLPVIAVVFGLYVAVKVGKKVISKFS